MSEHKWEVGPVKLLDGNDGHIDFIQLNSEVYRYFGRVKNTDGQWRPYCWGKLGMAHMAPKDYAMNLAPPQKKKIRVHCFANVYADGDVFTYGARKFADESSRKDRFALIEIDREVEEGEGLDPNVRSDAANVRSENQ